MSSNLRRQVLHTFKTLHYTRKHIFEGDRYALAEARKKINEGFKKNKHVSDEEAIQELVRYSEEVEKELRTCVIQAKQVGPGKFQAEIKQDTLKLENAPFNENAVISDNKVSTNTKRCRK